MPTHHPTNSDAPTPPPLGEHVTVDGHHLSVHKSGTGTPSVVFLPGAGLTGLDFLDVHQQIATSTTSVVYDRAGTGWSSDVPLPRTPDQVTDELRALLHAADVPAPYLLVGHSLGAFYARRYAQRFGDEVAALLLLDPGHEDILDFMPPEAAGLNEKLKLDPATLPDLTAEQIDAARTQYRALYGTWPEPVREALIDHNLAAWRTQFHETDNFEGAVYDQLRAGGDLPDIPLIVLTAKGRNHYWAQVLTEEQMRQAHDGVNAMHAALVASVPHGEHRELEGASHQYLHIEQRDAVVEAIGDLIVKVRGRRSAS
ncbi:alpha/beta hydrolase [Phytomonospora sp. NPDC050363]|uniref:alpha/beta fold hydrolase n=1 Tax=Phytomonospora sp. NPDC050363 TaxID=3155642 RepID=UPI0033D63092